MKYTIILITIVINCAISQTKYNYSSQHIVDSKFQISENQITNLELNPILKNDKVLIDNINLKNGDLLINIQVSPFRKIEKDLLISVTPKIEGKTGMINLVNKDNILGTNISYNSQNQKSTIIWKDFMEDYKYLENDLMLNLDYSIQGNLPARVVEKPEMTKKHVLPHYYIGIGSALVTTSGALLKESSNVIYDNYINEVFQQNDEAINTYNKANERKRLGNFMMVSGLVTLGTNAIVYITRKLIHNRRKNQYDHYAKLNIIGN